MSTFKQTQKSLHFKKIPARYLGIVMPFILSFFISGIISAILTIKNGGFQSGVFFIWLSSWGLAWSIAFPSVLIMLPIVRRFVGLIVEPTNH
ncbi:DUF2798 domain-containing protein [Candidatus Paracaedibacter symbiosus]|uniref:DUF2798 domain-containing protein n=1 Tax=Candidatus Paracaedibacter symbiosus TaxID=244582 RepID=UPI000509BF34|nr:DUF2798 domain-containing protein [Candidatus Paracaedibacter symbiosus]